MAVPDRNTLDDLWSADRALQNAAYRLVIEATDLTVPWSYEVWDEALANLDHKDNHNRAIAAQLLSNLAKSDPEMRLLRDFERLLQVTRDERFVTARHTIQNLWKVGAVGPAQRKRLMEGLEARYRESVSEKNGTLIRYDIIESMRKIFDASSDESVKATALELIAAEDDVKYRKKYASLWKGSV